MKRTLSILLALLLLLGLAACGGTEKAVDAEKTPKQTDQPSAEPTPAVILSTPEPTPEPTPMPTPEPTPEPKIGGDLAVYVQAFSGDSALKVKSFVEAQKLTYDPDYGD